MAQETVFFDTHAHFLGDDIEQLLERAEAAGVKRIVAVGGSDDLNNGALAAYNTAPHQVLLALGLDRAQTTLGNDEIVMLEESARNYKVSAIGEMGLDYHYDAATRSQQLKLFARMLELAGSMGVPAIIHTREADDDTLAVIREVVARASGERLGVVHCFTGSREFAGKILDLGLYISFSGIVTFRNAEALRAVAAYVPADRILIETDTPFLTPVPLRGKPNEPAFVQHVASCIAKQRKVSIEELAMTTTQNGLMLFGAPLVSDTGE